MRNPNYLLLILIFLSSQLLAQDTVYYSQPCIETKQKSECSFYTVTTRDKSDTSIKYYNAYFASGAIKSKATIIKGVETGKTIEYYETGKVHYEVECDQHGVQSIHSYWKLGAPKRSEIYKNGTRVQGTCYNLMGKEIPFTPFEEEAQFPGGEDSLIKFLNDKIIYPQEAQAKNIQGKVIVTFVIKADGSIYNPRVIKSVDPQIDAEALRVIRIMPKWKPSKQDGEATNQAFTIPIVFQI